MKSVIRNDASRRRQHSTRYFPTFPKKTMTRNQSIEVHQLEYTDYFAFAFGRALIVSVHV